MIVPITYFCILIWLILLYLPELEYLKLFGNIFGYFLAIKTIGGQVWVAVDNTTNALSIVTFSDGFQLAEGLIIIGFNTVFMYYMLLNILAERKNASARGYPQV